MRQARGLGENRARQTWKCFMAMSLRLSERDGCAGNGFKARTYSFLRPLRETTQRDNTQAGKKSEQQKAHAHRNSGNLRTVGYGAVHLGSNRQEVWSVCGYYLGNSPATLTASHQFQGICLLDLSRV